MLQTGRRNGRLFCLALGWVLAAAAAIAQGDMLVGGGQPGRMSIAEEKIDKLMRNDIRRSVYDRLVNVVITTVVSALIAFHDKWWK